jgi:hypothetical protein
LANHRPKSLSELNNVYDKAMRAERAIKESSSLLSITEEPETPQSENIFQQLENEAAQAEKNQVFDPDITNIANDFLKRYAQAEKPKSAPKEIKRPAPSIQSVYHNTVKANSEEKQDISLNMSESAAFNFDTPAVPLHKPAPTIPEAKPSPVADEIPAEPIQAPVVVAPATVTSEPQIQATETNPVTDNIADTSVYEKPQTVTAKPSATRPTYNAPSRVRITSTERNELMEEYLRVMSDDDDDDSYRKPKFSFFKKKRKYEEEPDTEQSANLYEDLPDEEEETDEEISVVPFDNSDVKYTDEYSDSPIEPDSPVSQEQMNIYDYIEADFDYDESDNEDDGVLDVSLAPEINSQEEVVADPTEISEETSEDTEENSLEEITQETEELPETQEEDLPTQEEDLPTQENSLTEELSEEAEEVVYPEAENDEVACEDAPPSDMVFEDIFSVTDESKRSHTGGNWEEVFGENFVMPTEEQSTVSQEEYPEYSDDDSYEEYAQPIEEFEAEPEFKEQKEAVYKEKSHSFVLKLIAIIIAVICILAAASTLLISTLLDVNSGNLVSERYRVFSAEQDFNIAGITENTLIITENIYAHVDDIYVYLNDTTASYEFGKVTANVPTLTGDYVYLTDTDSGSKIINRDNSMGVVIATYSGIGGILATICNNYMLIAAVLLIIAIAMIICLVLISKRKASQEDHVEEYENTDDSNDEDTDSHDSDTDTDEIDDYDDGEYYSDYDTDGIEQGLFNGI